MPLTARQQTIETWLRKAYPHAADQFLSGLRVREDAGMPCRTSLMGHAFREVCIAINNVHSSNSRKLEPAIDAMVREFHQLNYERTLLTSGEGDAVPVPDNGFVEVSTAFMHSAADVVEARDSQLSGRDRTLIAFQAISGASGVPTDITPTAHRWHAMYNHFVRCVHNPTVDDEGTEFARLDLELQFFEETLESFAQSAIANLDDLDAILESANT